MVRPQLEYASDVWDPYHVEDIVELEKVQRRAAHWVMNNYGIDIVLSPQCLNIWHGQPYSFAINHLDYKHYTRAGLSIPEALGKLNIGGPLPTYVEDQKKVIITSNSWIWDQNIV